MTVRRLIPFAVLLVAAGLVLGQGAPKKDAPSKEPPKPTPGSLEDTLEKALRNSADIKAAESKVRDAEAELNRVRQQVLTKATALHTDLNLAKRMLAVAENALTAANNRTAKVGPDGSTDAITARSDAILAAETMVAKHRGEVDKLEAELKSIRGEFALSRHRGVVSSVAFSPDGRLIASTELEGEVRIWDAVTGGELKYLDSAAAQVKGKSAPAVQAPMMDRVKKLLDQEVQFEAGGEPIDTILQFLLESAKSDIPVRSLLAAPMFSPALKGKLTVGAWMQAIEDTDSSIRIVVRDYGLLLTTRDRVPEGALRVQDLWKGNYAELKKPDTKGPEKK
jgi:hypothetical protein